MIGCYKFTEITVSVVLLLSLGLCCCTNVQGQADSCQADSDTLSIERAYLNEPKPDNASPLEELQRYPAFSAVHHFYVKYITELIREDGMDSKKIKAIQKQYVTQQFLDKLKKKFQDMELDYDPFLEAQDCDKSVLDSLRIERDPVRTDIYRVYLWDKFNRKYNIVTLSLKMDGQEYKIYDILSL